MSLDVCQRLYLASYNNGLGAFLNCSMGPSNTSIACPSRNLLAFYHKSLIVLHKSVETEVTTIVCLYIFVILCPSRGTTAVHSWCIPTHAKVDIRTSAALAVLPEYL